MSAGSRIGVGVAGVSIAFSMFSILLYFAFTPVFLISALLGAIGAACALASKARRTALVAAIFGLVPLAQLLVETFIDNEYFVLVPAALSFFVSGFIFANYSQERRVRLRPAT